MEQDLGVGRALHLWVERRIDLEHEVALDGEEVVDQAVVHPQPAAVAERVAVRLLDRRPGGGADVRKHDARPDVAGELTQVAIVPGRPNAVEEGRRVLFAVPTDAEPVSVRLLGSQLRMQALDDQGVLGLVEQLLQEHG